MKYAFRIAVVASLLGLAGWAMWTGGIADNEMQRTIRASSVYADPGTGLDVAAAERAIGNRRLVIVMLKPDADLEKACEQAQRPAKGTLVLVLSRGEDRYKRYGCASFDPAELSVKSFVSEGVVAQGIDGLFDKPNDAVKLAAVNYDRLVRAGQAPDGARTITASLPRFLIAGGAIAAVVIGSLVIWLGARRAGRLAAARDRARATENDRQTEVAAAVSALARQIVAMDGQSRTPDLETRYRVIVSRYADLLDDPDPVRIRRISGQLRELTDDRRKLLNSGKPRRKNR